MHTHLINQSCRELLQPEHGSVDNKGLTFKNYLFICINLTKLIEHHILCFYH